MSSAEKAEAFARLHTRDTPLILYNVWDAGSAKAVANAGAEAIGTSSWAIAEAHGYRDGEAIPLVLVEHVIARIASTCDLPLTVDFEGGYSEEDSELADNVSRLVDLGVVGINFEDRVVHRSGLYSIERQADRIGAIREFADSKGIGLFINARTDLFLEQGSEPARLIDAAIERGAAYAAAGASGFFVPGLSDEALIARICREVPLPVNVMMGENPTPTAHLKALGVSRISYGPMPYIRTIATLREAAGIALRS